MSGQVCKTAPIGDIPLQGSCSGDASSSMRRQAAGCRSAWARKGSPSALPAECKSTTIGRRTPATRHTCIGCLTTPVQFSKILLARGNSHRIADPQEICALMSDVEHKGPICMWLMTVQAWALGIACCLQPQCQSQVVLQPIAEVRLEQQRSNVLPEAKAQLLRDLKRSARILCMCDLNRKGPQRSSFRSCSTCTSLHQWACGLPDARPLLCQTDSTVSRSESS